jgi:hypothetical protein
LFGNHKFSWEFVFVRFSAGELIGEDKEGKSLNNKRPGLVAEKRGQLKEFRRRAQKQNFSKIV